MSFWVGVLFPTFSRILAEAKFDMGLNWIPPHKLDLQHLNWHCASVRNGSPGVRRLTAGGCGCWSSGKRVPCKLNSSQSHVSSQKTDCYIYRGCEIASLPGQQWRETKNVTLLKMSYIFKKWSNFNNIFGEDPDRLQVFFCTLYFQVQNPLWKSYEQKCIFSNFQKW